MVFVAMVMVLCRGVSLAAKDSLHEGASAHVLDVAQHGEVVGVLGLPAFFDAIIDESDQTGSDNDTIRWSPC